jgi:hypothetical protein
MLLKRKCIRGIFLINPAFLLSPALIVSLCFCNASPLPTDTGSKPGEKAKQRKSDHYTRKVQHHIVDVNGSVGKSVR